MASKGLTFYKIKSSSDAPNAKKIIKFDQDLEKISEYNLTYFEGKNGGYYDCNCPASRFDCRHKDILKQFETHNQVDGDKFFCFEAKTWKTPEELGIKTHE